MFQGVHRERIGGVFGLFSRLGRGRSSAYDYTVMIMIMSILATPPTMLAFTRPSCIDLNASL